MKFLILLEQNGEGCDYTIGCGINFEEIEAKDLKSACQRVVENYGDGEYSCEGGLKSIRVIEIADESSMDMDSLEKFLEKEDADEQRNEMIKQYLDLKQRLGIKDSDAIPEKEG